MNTLITEEGWMVIAEDTHVSKWIIENKKLDHDEFLIPIAVSNIPEGGICIDVGSLYGDHSIAYARKVGGAGTIIAIEPNPMAYSCLMHNAKKFEATTYCINAVVCEEHGGNAIHTVQELNNIGASTCSYEPTDKGVEIRTISIDGLTMDADFPRIDFIKIDAEGWEAHILRGARGAIAQFKPKLMIEINLGALLAQKSTDKDIYEILLALNYSWRIIQSDCTGSSPQFDILAWPNQVEIIEGRKVLDPKNENQ